MNKKCFVLFFLTAVVFCTRLTAMRKPVVSEVSLQETENSGDVFFGIDKKIVMEFHQKVRLYLERMREDDIPTEEEIDEVGKMLSDHPKLVNTKVGGRDVLMEAIDRCNFPCAVILFENGAAVSEDHVQRVFNISDQSESFIRDCDECEGDHVILVDNKSHGDFACHLESPLRESGEIYLEGKARKCEYCYYKEYFEFEFRAENPNASESDVTNHVNDQIFRHRLSCEKAVVITKKMIAIFFQEEPPEKK